MVRSLGTVSLVNQIVLKKFSPCVLTEGNFLGVGGDNPFVFLLI